MIIFYLPQGERAESHHLSQAEIPKYIKDAIWIDLFNPTQDEEKTIEDYFNMDVPLREEQKKLKPSRRLYQHRNSLFMTAHMVRADESARTIRSFNVTFILTHQGPLVTLRYNKVHALEYLQERWKSFSGDLKNGVDVFEEMISAIVERAAEVLEDCGNSLDKLSLVIFDRRHIKKYPSQTHEITIKPKTLSFAPPRNFDPVLTQLGYYNDLISKVQETLVSFSRLTSFYCECKKKNGSSSEVAIHNGFMNVHTDLKSLSDHANFLLGQGTFLLDATLGMITNDQNGIIKIVSVAALIFLPPTLIASIYGMNFHHMPELDWSWGYPLAMMFMVLAAVLPYLFFKRCGWL